MVLEDFSLYGIQYQVMNGIVVKDMDFEVVFVDDKTGEEFERTSVFDE